MNYTLKEAELRINISARAIQNYLENDKIHSPNEISSYIKSTNNSGKRMITEKGFNVALQHYGQRIEVVSDTDESFLQAMVYQLTQDKDQLNKQIEFTQAAYESTKLLAESTESEIKDLRLENNKKTELIHESQLRIIELENQINNQNNKTLIQRIFKK